MVKTDNHNPLIKLDLRRYFLRKYHADGSASVLDCCQGGGVMWSTLRKEFPIAAYWGVDLKPKKGRLKIDSVRILAQSGWTQNVIDIDTYGSPWKHWFAMLPNLRNSATIFLTIGQCGGGGGMGTQRMQRAAMTAIGLDAIADNMPAGFEAKLHDIATSHCLTRCCDYDKIAIEAVEAVSDGNARYIGVRLEPMKTPAVEVETPKRAKHKQAKKEPARV